MYIIISINQSLGSWHVTSGVPGSRQKMIVLSPHPSSILLMFSLKLYTSIATRLNYVDTFYYKIQTICQTRKKSLPVFTEKLHRNLLSCFHVELIMDLKICQDDRVLKQYPIQWKYSVTVKSEILRISENLVYSWKIRDRSLFGFFFFNYFPVYFIEGHVREL